MSTKPEKPKLIVIVGPTASGKSELAVILAKKFNGEIISADSRQVYRNLDIGTGKVPGMWVIKKDSTTKRSRYNCNIFVYKKIPHYCIDFVDPKKQYTVVKFKQCADEAIRDISKRGKIPIVVGGTGFWIDAVVGGAMLPEVPPNKTLRKRFKKKTAAELFRLLKKLDPRRAKTIDPYNPRRLIRAIEIARALGSVPKIQKRSQYQTLWIGLNPHPEILGEKIKTRLAARIQNGMISEARRLRKQKVSWQRFHDLGLEYWFLGELLRKKISRDTFAEKLFYAILHYAKRQHTWFKRNKKICWIRTARQAELLMKKFLKP